MLLHVCRERTGRTDHAYTTMYTDYSHGTEVCKRFRESAVRIPLRLASLYCTMPIGLKSDLGVEERAVAVTAQYHVTAVPVHHNSYEEYD